MPEIRALWDEAFIFRALSDIFRAQSIQPHPKNGPYAYAYTTVDGRRLIAVANTLGALVLGGVHSNRSITGQRDATDTVRRCLNSVNCTYCQTL